MKQSEINALNILNNISEDSTADLLEKSMGHKYFKREGSPGHYKYYYTEEEYDKEKGVKDKKENISHSDRIKKRAEESKNWTPEQHKKKAKELNSQMIALEAKGKGNTKEYKELKEDRDSHEAKARKKSFLSNVEKFEKVWGKGDV